MASLTCFGNTVVLKWENKVLFENVNGTVYQYELYKKKKKCCRKLEMIGYRDDAEYF